MKIKKVCLSYLLCTFYLLFTEVYKYFQDTFYDPEDGSSRRLKLTLMTIDRTQVPTNSWLQFDAKNQEFYGIPLWGDKNFSEYQLVS